MPTFYTKTISSILEPVAQQVSHLVILHEQAESGVKIPDLTAPITLVKAAVTNLTIIGSQTYKLSRDEILKRDMPPALKRVEDASSDLEIAATLLGKNQSSLDARKKLIEGSRGILQGTSSVLVVYDLSEVRKIITTCNNVKYHLNLVENIRSMEELAAFIKNLTPHLTGMTKLTMARAEELIIKTHSDILIKSIDQIKNGIPILLSSLKTLIICSENEGNNATVKECRMNRNYSVLKLLDHVQEIIRVLQMAGESGAAESVWWENEQIEAIRLAKTKIDSRAQLVYKWIDCIGTQNIYETNLYDVATQDVLNNFQTISSNCPDDTIQSDLQNLIESQSTDYGTIKSSIDRGETLSPEMVTPMRHRFKVTFERANQKADEVLSRAVGELTLYGGGAGTVGGGQMMLARTIEGRITQANAWLANPDGHEQNLGMLACMSLANEADHVSRLLHKQQGGPTAISDSLRMLSDAVRKNTDKLNALVSTGKSRTNEGMELIQSMFEDLSQLQTSMSAAVIDRVANNFVDMINPIRKLQEASMSITTTPQKIQEFNEAANKFMHQGESLCETASLVPSTAADAQRVAQLKQLNDEIHQLTPQVVNAGKIVLMNGGQNCAQPMKDHFTNLCDEWSNNVNTLTNHVDKLTDTAAFVAAQEAAIEAESERMESSIRECSNAGIVEGTSNIARRAGRTAQKAEVELSQTEDTHYLETVGQSVGRLKSAITPMAISAKNLMINPQDNSAIQEWRCRNDELREAVHSVKISVTPATIPNISTSLRSLSISTTDSRSDNENDDNFNYPEAQSNQPILAAAHILHTEARQWSSKDNEIVAAAKRMAKLMAQLSQLVRVENASKKDLIDVAKQIAQASEDVTKCARKLGEACTDIRIKDNLLQICDRLPTIGTQLRILSTVKATMLGSQEDTEDLSEVLTYVTHDESELNCGSDEDQEATEMLVGNAQNLMQNVIETVHAAEAASIKLRVDSGYRIRWTRKTPWYQQQQQQQQVN